MVLEAGSELVDSVMLRVLDVEIEGVGIGALELELELEVEVEVEVELVLEDEDEDDPMSSGYKKNTEDSVTLSWV